MPTDPSALKEYRIRVKPMVPWPGRHGETRRKSTAGVHYNGVFPKCSEELWLVLGAPVEPDSGWNCGTDVVWPVLGIEGAENFKLLALHHVCRHQIQIGD